MSFSNAVIISLHFLQSTLQLFMLLRLVTSTLYILVLFILDRDGFRRNFNSQDRLEYAFLGIKIAHQGIPAGRKSAKMYKVEVTFESKNIVSFFLPNELCYL